jgi:hypothetical protein
MSTDTRSKHPLPRSALRYRPIAPARTTAAPPTMQTTRPRRSSLAIPDVSAASQEDLDDARPTSGKGSAIRRATPARAYTTGQRRFHPLFFLGLSLFAILLLSLGVTQALAWGTNVLNGWRYGYPRTFQIDAVVGHQDSPTMPSHFLAINLHGLVEIIEWPGGDAAHARIFLGPQLFGPQSDLEPVVLRFADLNGDHLHDMIIEVAGSRIVFINARGTFRPLQPNEQNQVMQALQRLGQ